MLLAQSAIWGHFPDQIQFGFWGEGETKVSRENTLGARVRTNKKLNPREVSLRI